MRVTITFASTRTSGSSPTYNSSTLAGRILQIALCGGRELRRRSDLKVQRPARVWGFRCLTRLPRAPTGLLATLHWSPGTGLTVRPGWNQWAQPNTGHPRRLCHLACHSQRSQAVCSGQPRSLGEGQWPGLNGSDLGWRRRPKLHGMQGVKAGIGRARLGRSCPRSRRTGAP